jgi:DNA polymerase-4
MHFNQNSPRIVHLDINSCFATVEQQANPLLRDKPVVVAAYTTNSGCVLAASVTAKKLGIKTGMRVMDARLIYPKVVVLSPDPPKYRFIHNKIKKILKNYSTRVIPKSIDEFVFETVSLKPQEVSLEIKKRIREEVGEYITVSIGISTNRYLAKVASNLQKPDGLSEINKDNIKGIFSKLKLTDLTGIKKGNSKRLNLFGIKTATDFLEAPVPKLKLAFGGIGGLYWYLRLHGMEIDDFKSKRGMYGNSFAPPPNKANQTLPILSKLSEKTGLRLRNANLKASGVHLFLQDRDGNSWHMGKKLNRDIFNSNDIYKEMNNLLSISPIKDNLRHVAISTFNLKPKDSLQLEIFSNVLKKDKLTNSLDFINTKYGDYTIYPARMINTKDIVKDRIAFGL